MGDRLRAVMSTIKPEQLKEYLTGDDIKVKLANMKIDKVLKAFFDDMLVDGKEPERALEFIKKGIIVPDESEVVYVTLLSRGKEYVDFLNNLKTPETRLAAIKELQNRNMI